MPNPAVGRHVDGRLCEPELRFAWRLGHWVGYGLFRAVVGTSYACNVIAQRGPTTKLAPYSRGEFVELGIGQITRLGEDREDNS